MVFTSAGVLVLLAAFLPSRSSQAATGRAGRDRHRPRRGAGRDLAHGAQELDAVNEEVAVTVTGEEIVQRTATTSLRLSWT